MRTINKKGKGERMELKKYIRKNLVGVNFNLVYDYERDDNFNWESLRQLDLISYLFSKSEEMRINRIEYTNEYSKKELIELKFWQCLYFNSAVYFEGNPKLRQKMQKRISK